MACGATPDDAAETARTSTRLDFYNGSSENPDEPAVVASSRCSSCSSWKESRSVQADTECKRQDGGNGDER
jgi:hypothetical protein